MLFSSRTAVSYFCEVLGITKSKISYCKKTGKGFSNHSFCVIVQGKNAYHVRIANSGFPIDRAFEKAVMELMGFDFLDFNIKSGNYVRKWLNGTTARNWSESLLRSLVVSLKVLHSTDALPEAPVFNPNFYDERKSLPAKYSSKYKLLVAKNSSKADFCLCHNDVHSSNIVLQGKNRLVLIDYEWASMNSPFWELGNFVREEGLSETQIGILLNEYKKGLDLPTLREYVFMAACYGWLWARCMPLSFKIVRQRIKTTADLKNSFKKLSVVF